MNFDEMEEMIREYIWEHGIDTEALYWYPNDHGNIFKYYLGLMSDFDSIIAFKNFLAKDIIISERNLQLKNCKDSPWNRTCPQEVDDLKILFKLLFGDKT